MKFYLTQFILLLCFSLGAKAQLVFDQYDSVKVKINGQEIKNPWAGGINYGQYSAIDLNLDGTKDLVVFDRTGNKILPFINNGTPQQVDYVYAPSYRSKFPPLHDWALFFDYNGDGKEDIFSYSFGGFSVFKNISFPGVGLNFTLASLIVKSHYSSAPTDYTGLYVSRVDIPGIADIDYDGDLDVLTFDINSGSYIEFHQNMSMEIYGVPDSLNEFKKQGSCWGSIAANSTNTVVLNVACKPSPGSATPLLDPNAKPLHVGSTETMIDIDNDHDYDMLLGGVSTNDLNLLTNGGDSISAHITAQQNNFPQSNVPVNITIFPACFHLDVDNDGNKDLIVAPNAGNSSENFNSSLYYRDIDTSGASNFVYQTNAFLQDQMIEVGEGAYPCFFDYNADGLKDLLLGNYGYFNAGGSYSCKLALFKNIGSPIQPEFELITRDYAGLGSFNLGYILPAVGDVDGDGDQDLMVGTNNNAGSILFFENLAGAGNTANFVLANSSFMTAIGQSPAPQLVDVNRDGKLDLLIGFRDGTLAFSRNLSTVGNLSFAALNTSFGNVHVAPNGGFVGHAYPQLIDEGGNFHLYVGNVDGHIYHYDNIDGNLAGTFNLQDSLYRNINEGDRISLAFADLNNDGYQELVIGNYSGGLTFFKGKQKVTGLNEFAENFSPRVSIYPNPAGNSLELRLMNLPQSTLKQISIYSVHGAIIKKQSMNSNSIQLETADWKNGIYNCRIETDGKVLWKKFAIVH